MYSTCTLKAAIWYIHVHVHCVKHDTSAVENESEVSESTEEVDGEDEGEGVESDYPDTPHFTPFPNRNTITSEM